MSEDTQVLLLVLALFAAVAIVAVWVLTRRWKRRAAARLAGGSAAGRGAAPAAAVGEAGAPAEAGVPAGAEDPDPARPEPAGAEKPAGRSAGAATADAAASSEAPGPTEQRIRWAGDPAAFAPGPRHWPLAVAALTGPFGDSPWNQVRSDDPEAIRRMLASEWGSTSRWELLDTMQSLLTRGHRAYFSGEIDMWVGLNAAEAEAQETELHAVADRSDDDAERLWRFRRVRADDRGIRSVDLTAWDLGRFAMLARAGATVGFLSEDEALDMIAMTAPDLRRRYGSWEEFGEAFHAGRWYADSHGGVREQALLREDAGRRAALLGPDGPWARVAWDGPVDESRMRFVDALVEEDLIDRLHSSMRGIASPWELRLDDELRRRAEDPPAP